MVLNRSHLRLGGEKCVEVPAPSRRIVAVAEVLHRGPRQDALDPSTKPARGFGFVLPNGTKDFQDQRRVDRRHGKVAYQRVRVGVERGLPLAFVLDVLNGASCLPPFVVLD